MKNIGNKWRPNRKMKRKNRRQKRKNKCHLKFLEEKRKMR